MAWLPPCCRPCRGAAVSPPSGLPAWPMSADQVAERFSPPSHRGLPALKVRRAKTTLSTRSRRRCACAGSPCATHPADCRQAGRSLADDAAPATHKFRKKRAGSLAALPSQLERQRRQSLLVHSLSTACPAKTRSAPLRPRPRTANAHKSGRSLARLRKRAPGRPRPQLAIRSLAISRAIASKACTRLAPLLARYASAALEAQLASSARVLASCSSRKAMV